MAKIKITPKVLVVNNQDSINPLGAANQWQWNIIQESDPEKIFQRWGTEVPDIIIFDVDLPEAPLIESIKKLRFETISPILILTTNQSEEFLLDVYRAGVDECVLKPVSPSLIYAKIKAWLRRSGNAPLGMLNPFKVGNVQLIPAERIVTLENGRPVHLTNLEFRLLYCLMSQPGRTFSSEGLVQRIWGHSSSSDNASLKNIIYRLRQRIEVDPASPMIIQTVLGVGYRFVAGEQ